MSDQEILEVFSDILRTILSDETIELDMNTVRDDVPNWDSFMNINFMAVVEEEFNIQFEASNIESFNCVGEIVRNVRELAA